MQIDDFMALYKIFLKRGMKLWVFKDRVYLIENKIKTHYGFPIIPLFVFFQKYAVDKEF